MTIFQDIITVYSSEQFEQVIKEHMLDGFKLDNITVTQWKVERDILGNRWYNSTMLILIFSKEG